MEEKRQVANRNILSHEILLPLPNNTVEETVLQTQIETLQWQLAQVFIAYYERKHATDMHIHFSLDNNGSHVDPYIDGYISISRYLHMSVHVTAIYGHLAHSTRAVFGFGWCACVRDARIQRLLHARSCANISTLKYIYRSGCEPLLDKIGRQSIAVYAICKPNSSIHLISVCCFAFCHHSAIGGI